MVIANLVLRMQTAAEWDAAGHADPWGWLGLAGRVASVLLVVAFVGLALRAFTRRARYVGASQLSAADRDELLREVEAVERRTVGEVVPVVLDRSDAYPVGDWIAGTVALLIGTACVWCFHVWTAPVAVFTGQIVFFGVGFGLARALPDFRRLFVSERRADELALEQARQEFFAAGLHRTEAQTGVLLFVSLFEHRVIVLGDTGIDAKVDEELWTQTADTVLAGIRRGDLAGGLRAGLQVAGDVLTEHFPWTEGDRDEVPNRVIVRPE